MFGAHRLPGIAFEAVPPAAPEALPPMDIALFAGFAAMGPVHRPVRVEDFAAFRRVFGDDCPLAFGARSDVPVSAALAPSVRAFFANGGRRCWVVRVARTAELEALVEDPSRPAGEGVASPGRFELPGIAALHRDGSTSRAFAQARSVGSWSDRLSVAARVERSPILVSNLALSGIAPTRLASGPIPVELAQLTFTTSATLAVGDLIQFDDALGTVFAAVESLVGGVGRASLLAEAIPPSPPGESPPLASPPQSPPLDSVIFGGRLPRGDAAAARVRLELRVDNGLARETMPGIGLTPAHPQCWWANLPDDARPDDVSPTLLIAADEAELDATQQPLAWLPIGLDGLFSDPASAQHDGRTSLERDGLSHFDSQLFLDPSLASVSATRLIEEAERIEHLEGRRLLGIHSVLGIGQADDFNQVSLLAAPDASQPGWVTRLIGEAPDPTSSEPPPAHWFDHRGPCARVPANAPARRDPDRSGFLDCATRVLPTPQFKTVEHPRKPGPLELQWTNVEPGLDHVLEIARSAKFTDAETVHEGPETSCIVTLATDGFYYFRLRARQGDEVSAAATLVLTVMASDWMAVDPDDFDPSTLMSVQRALLRLACASGEMFALLSLPRHYRIAEAVRHGRELRTIGGAFGRVGQLGWNERRALSFGALHHPWIVSPAGTGKLVAMPPEGAIAGVHARRTLDRGAWIAAANERLRDVVAVDSAIADSDWLQADQNRLNLVRRDPRGFLVLDSDTLSDEPEWRQINVRRLMSLLRRVALRRGAAYVFEPNGDVLRRAVERGFSELLDRLFRLGAFAGGKADEAYRLAVITTPQDRDAGRLIVEIGVAPSQPLRFLTVRLVQSGGRFAVAQEG